MLYKEKTKQIVNEKVIMRISITGILEVMLWTRELMIIGC